MYQFIVIAVYCLVKCKIFEIKTFRDPQQQKETEKNTKLGDRKGSGIEGNPECVVVGELVGVEQC